MKCSAIERCTSTRWVEMQLCPAWANPATRIFDAAVFQSLSAFDDDRGVVAELEADLLARSPAADAPTDLGRPGERDQGDVGMVDDRVADRAATAGDDVQPLRRQTALVDQQLGEGDRRQRRLAGGLEHHRAAGGDGRGQLVGDQVEREVERRDRADDADRHAQGEADLALAGGGGVERHHLTVERARLGGGEPERADRPLRLGAGGPDRLGGLGGDDAGEALLLLGERHRGAVEHLGPLPAGSGDSRQGRRGDGDGTVDVGGGARGDGAHERSVVR